MRRSVTAIATIVLPAALTVGAAAGIGLAVRAPARTRMVAICYGAGCRGPSRDPATIVHSTCQDTLRHRRTACPVPADEETIGLGLVPQ
jgi:hypothetical protein